MLCMGCRFIRDYKVLISCCRLHQKVMYVLQKMSISKTGALHHVRWNTNTPKSYPTEISASLDLFSLFQALTKPYMVALAKLLMAINSAQTAWVFTPFRFWWGKLLGLSRESSCGFSWRSWSCHGLLIRHQNYVKLADVIIIHDWL